jgi:hypothetical protein
MNCYVHPQTAAVGFCAVCQKGVCADCVGRDSPRLVCRTCLERGALMLGYEYKSSAAIGNWPLLHICTGVDPQTFRPRIAKGVIAIGNISIGAVAIGGLACGLLGLGGLSIGLLVAFGGVALGMGLSVGGLAIGSIAVGGAAIGFSYAIGGAAFAPAAIDPQHCDPAARDLLLRWLGSVRLPADCR